MIQSFKTNQPYNATYKINTVFKDEGIKIGDVMPNFMINQKVNIRNCL